MANAKRNARKSILASNIANRRKAMKMNQREFAALAGIGESTLKEIEADISHGSQPIKQAIADALNCTVDDLHQAPAEPRDNNIVLSDLFRAITKVQETLVRGVDKIQETIEKRTPEQEQALLDQADLIHRLTKKISELEIVNEQYLLRLNAFDVRHRTMDLVGKAHKVINQKDHKGTVDTPTPKSRRTKRK